MSKPDHAPDDPPDAPFSQEDWDAVSDNPEWTERDFATARPFAEVFPDLAARLRRARGPQKARVKRRDGLA